MSQLTGATPAGPQGDVTCTVDDDVATLTLTRPGKHNALTNHMWELLARQVRRLDDDPVVRVIVVRGHGGVFSSGADLAEVTAACESEAAATAFCRRTVGALLALARSPKVTIAALTHHVTGGGAELALACDLRVADSSVIFQIPVARLGLVADRLTVDRLLQLGGPGVARSVLLLSRKLDAETLLRVGLVEELVAPGGLDRAVADIATAVRANSGRAIAATKEVLLDEENLRDEDALITEFVDSLAHGDVAERGRDLLALMAGRRSVPR